MNKVVILLSVSLSICSILLSDISHIESDSENLRFDFELGDYEIDQLEFQGEKFTKIRSGSNIVTEAIGFPELPFFSVAVQIDPELDYEIRIMNAELSKINPQAPPLPSSGITYRSNNEILNKNYHKHEYLPEAKTNKFYPESSCTLSTPYIVRDVRGVNLRVSPFQYNYVTNELKIWNKFTIELVPIRGKLPTNPLIRKKTSISSELNNLYNSVFVNYEDNRDLLYLDESGSILIVYTERDAMAIAPYVNWKNQMGYNVFKAEVSSGTNIKEIVLQSYLENPEIFYVIIIGDFIDLESDLGTQQNRPMDPQLGCVEGDDLYPDLAVGRLTAKTAIDIEIQIDKIIQYEKYADLDDSWMGHSTGIASNSGSTNGDDGERDWQHLEVIWENKLSQYSYSEYRPIYEPDAGETMIASSLNNGTGLVNYTGHGSISTWETGDFDIYDIEYLDNDGFYPLIFSAACSNGAFDYGLTDCLAEKFLKKNGGGAAFMLASSIVQPWAPPMRGQDYIMDIITGGYNYDDYPDQNGISTEEFRTRIGSIVLNGLLMMITESDQVADWDTFKTWTSFGDPSMQIRTHAPKEIFMTNDVIVEGQPFSTYVYSRNYDPEPNVWVTINRGDVSYSAYSDENGFVTVDHQFAEGTVHLTVTGYNLQTISKIVVLGAPGPYITLQMIDLHEDGSYEDGYLQPGDILDLDVVIQNVGSINTLGDISATISTDIDNVTILDGDFSCEGLLVEETASVADAFRIELEPGEYQSKSIEFQVEFSTSTESWSDDFSFNITLPKLHLKSWRLESVSGSDDVLNPGEEAELNIQLMNSGNGISYEILGVVSDSNNWVTTGNNMEISSLLPDSAGWGEQPVSIALSESCSLGFIDLDLSFVDVLGTVADTTISIPVGVYLEDFESGFLNWNHQAMGDGNLDSWHISEQRNHSFGGQFSAKCGSADYQNYENNILSGLETPEFELENTQVSFYHYLNTLILNENSSWDGGYVELSVNGGEYFQIEPEGGYPYSICGFAGTPFAEDTPVFAGDIDWEQVEFDLSGYNGTGQLRFVFGSSESLNTGEGWYLDDIEFSYNVDGDNPEIPAADMVKLVNYPNPFNPTTTISFSTELYEPNNKIEIDIFNVKGQKIKSIECQLSETEQGNVQDKGSTNNVVWDGTDKHNNPVASGVYFAVLKSNNDKALASRKMLLLK